MWGGIKELAATWALALLAALAVPCARGAAASWRAVIPLAVASAALVGILSLGAAVWVAPVALVLVVLVWRAGGRAVALARAGAQAVSAS